jgi:hypothetical protein
MTNTTYDVIVIGAGPVGENVADRVVQGGLTAAVVERELVGGECSYWACMPTKALLRSAAALRAARQVPGAREAVTGGPDVAAVLRRRDSFASNWADDGQVSWLDSAVIALYRDQGRISSERVVEVTAQDGATTTLTARHAVVVATGSSALVPDVAGLREAAPWTSPVEAQGMAIFGRNHLDGRRTHERLVAHELAHQWFGNSLTVADWRHIWLNEDFATYAEWLWSGVCGDLPAEALAAQWYERIAARPQDVIVADPGINRMFDPLVYRRGALTVHAVRKRIGEESFFAMLRPWVAEHRHATVTTEQFRAHAQRFAREPLDGLFAAWLDSRALPPFPR